MNGLKTSPSDMVGWFGYLAIQQSDNLRLLPPTKARFAREQWDRFVSDKPSLVAHLADGGDDAS